MAGAEQRRPDPTPAEIAAAAAKIRAENEAQAATKEDAKYPMPWQRAYRDKKRYRVRRKR